MKHPSTTLGILSLFYIKQVWRELPFLIILICGLALQVAYTLIARGAYEAAVYPATYEILGVIRRFQPGILVLMALYSGELFAHERVIKISPLMDVLPYKGATKVISQIMAMTGVLISILLLMIIIGIGSQLSLGYYHIDLAQYHFTCFTELLFNGVFMIILAYFIHVLVNHKFLGHALCILLVIAQNYLSAWGLEHKLYHYSKLSLGVYSDLIGYQDNSLKSFLYYSCYWLGIALIFIQFIRLWNIRGIETGFRNRLKLARARFTGRLQGYFLLSLIIFMAAGISIYINTTVINDFQTRKALERLKYEYEHKLKPFESLPKPEIVAVSFVADLYPSQNAYELQGSYTLINSGVEPIAELHIQESPEPLLSLQSLEIDGKFALKESYPQFRYNIYALASPLLTGDSLVLRFKMRYGAKGFSQHRRQELTQNASFFTQAHLPALGYSPDFELEALPTRQKFGLKPKKRLPGLKDHDQYNIGLNAANNIAFDARLSTEAGYHATTSGELIHQWEENDRAYFHYKSKEPIENQYAVMTGKLSEQTSYVLHGSDSIGLSLFYHPAHTHNLKHITHAMTASFKSYQESFSPYQYDHLTIMEVPRLHDFAMSVPNTIAFSEAMGFMTKADNRGLNVPFYITAHEIAHQWWGDQVRGAIVEGEDMITETLAQYAAGMLTLKEFGEESMEHILKYERGRYLRGRKREAQNEQPLYKAEKQPYIHYGKGLVNMMALRHYISEDSVNSALRRVIRDFPASQAIYPNSLDVISAFRMSTPDSLQYLVTDLFERVIFLENSIQYASSKALANGNYQLSIKLATQKYEADTEGLLQPTPINDWIELAVYGMDTGGKEVMLYRQMHKFDKPTSDLTLNLDNKPTRIVIDPSFVLMDRNLNDNEWTF
jgi:hypothetical protein